MIAYGNITDQLNYDLVPEEKVHETCSSLNGLQRHFIDSLDSN